MQGQGAFWLRTNGRLISHGIIGLTTCIKAGRRSHNAYAVVFVGHLEVVVVFLRSPPG